MIKTSEGEKLYSQKDIADRLGTSKSTVYRIIKELGLTHSTKQSQTMLYDESVLKSVKKDFENRKLVQGSVNESAKSNDELIAQLKDDLQHERENVANLTRLLDQSQQLQLSLQQQIKALKAPQEATTTSENNSKANDDETTKDTEKATTEPDKLKWWQKIFR
ncbi:helix-turn-helix domain-containing protein [Limosilactobacillus reuteri]|uniref:helix-turn-helix domain-containing protein n=1 Tax=Limosilactobacillus reuteri TaxID=1598 RepID=UPI000A1DED51|nr:helix-turn-helix domain-containing protein [Limosilactobacillus reuteri]MQB79640.1 helix-turn-helix domain-containing protein [Limosilactobacillus reuteri]